MGRVSQRRRLDVRYPALPSQRRFHKSKARFKVFCGPVGTGKSMALCQEALWLAIKNPGRLGLIGAPTFAMLRDATARQFIDVLEASGLGYRFQRADNCVELENGSRIIFRSLDHFERLRGPNLAWFGVDELTYVAAEAWLRLEARLRDAQATVLRGFGVFTPKGFDWVYEKFASGSGSGSTSDYDLIHAEPFENRHILGAVPDFYERLERSYDARFYEQEVLGRFLNVRQGRAYNAFSREGNVREVSYDSGRPLEWAWDFSVSPMCSVICQRHGDEVVVLDEIVLPTSSTPEVCAEFVARWGHHALKPVGRPYVTSYGEVNVYGDASGNSTHSVSGRSDYTLIREFFRNLPGFQLRMQVPASNPPVRDRVNAVNARLANARGERRVSISPHCKDLIADLEQVAYKPNSTQIDKDDARRTHASDALGYYLWQHFRLGESVGEKSSGRLIV